MNMILPESKSERTAGIEERSRISEGPLVVIHPSNVGLCFGLVERWFRWCANIAHDLSFPAARGETIMRSPTP
jgi:hypothetical protein